jgi:hypothetical protein
MFSINERHRSKSQQDQGNHSNETPQNRKDVQKLTGRIDRSIASYRS